MNSLTTILIFLSLGCIFFVSSFPDSEARLWDYVIDAEFLNTPIEPGENPIIIGTVVDHAYNPIPDLEVKISFAGQSHLLKTDDFGKFKKQFDGNHLESRSYSANIIASSIDGKKGIERTTIQIDGHTEKSAKFDRQLKYLEMVHGPEKLRENSADPISLILYKHYLNLQENSTQAKYEESLLELPQKKIRDARVLANEKMIEVLEKRPLPTRQFDDSPKLIKFLDNLDDEKRILFELQQNSTKTRFIEAQTIMQDILMNGGSQNEARQAYLDYLSITQDEMNSLIKNLEKTEISSQPATNSTKN